MPSVQLAQEDFLQQHIQRKNQKNRPALLEETKIAHQTHVADQLLAFRGFHKYFQILHPLSGFLKINAVGVYPHMIQWIVDMQHTLAALGQLVMEERVLMPVIFQQLIESDLHKEFLADQKIEGLE